MSEFKEILRLLNIYEASLKCPICHSTLNIPTRIKICGHYFCSECLKKSKQSHNCPVCNEFYEPTDLTLDNVVGKYQEQLHSIRMLLETASSEATRDPNVKPKVIKYKSNEYQVNFLSFVGKTNAKGETPLHIACSKSKLEEVQNLIKSEVDINAKDYAGWTPLHEAIQSGSLEIVEFLLKNHCLIDIPGADYTTPLHNAVGLDNIDMVKLLLKYGADRNVVDRNGLKPIDIAKNEAIKMLLNNADCGGQKQLPFKVFLPSKVIIYCHSMDADKSKLKNAGMEVTDKMELAKKTHFAIKKTHKLSFKIMQAMLEGLQFVTEDCFDDYIKGNYFINIPKHTFLTNHPKLNRGIQKAMMSALLKLPSLFDRISFYIDIPSKNKINIHGLKVDKEYLSKLIEAGGGKVLHRPPVRQTCDKDSVHPYFASIKAGTYKCGHFIIYDERNPPDLLFSMPELQHKGSKWLINCIINYEIS